MKKKFSIFLIFLLGICLVSIGCNFTKAAAIKTENSKIKVCTSIYPIYNFTKIIAGNQILVENFVPFGTDPHSWEPTAKDIVALENSTIFIYNGAGMEFWVDDILEAINVSKLKLIKATENISLLEDMEDEDDHNTQKHSEDNKYDPHVWLDPLLAKDMAKNIFMCLSEADPENEEIYRKNYQGLLKELDKLDSQFREKLADVSQREFVINHAAFGYLAKRYNLKQLAVMGVNAEVEPTPDRMANLIDIVKDKKIKYIFTEELVSTKVSKVLASEVGVETLVLNSLGGLSKEDIVNGKDYFSVMYENLNNLVKALQ